MNHLSNLSIVEWVVLALAVFRLVRLFLYDHIFDECRHFLARSSQLLAFILTCHWCAGIWLATFVVAIYLFLPATFPFFIILSLAGASSLIHDWLDK